MTLSWPHLVKQILEYLRQFLTMIRSKWSIPSTHSQGLIQEGLLLTLYQVPRGPFIFWIVRMLCRHVGYISKKKTIANFCWELNRNASIKILIFCCFGICRKELLQIWTLWVTCAANNNLLLTASEKILLTI